MSTSVLTFDLSVRWQFGSGLPFSQAVGYDSWVAMVDSDVDVRGAVKLATVPSEQRELARLFRELARLRLDAPVSASVDELRWTGPTDAFPMWCDRIDATNLPARAAKLAQGRPAR